jgi:hypothetical protein
LLTCSPIPKALRFLPRHEQMRRSEADGAVLDL